MNASALPPAMAGLPVQVKSALFLPKPGYYGAQKQTACTEFAFKQCEGYLAQRINRPLFNLFRKLTGLRLHAWLRGTQGMPCFLARKHLADKAMCSKCHQKLWMKVWNCEEQRFTGLCGASVFCAAVRVAGQHPILLTVMPPAPVSREARKKFNRAIFLARVLLHDLQATIESQQMAVELKDAQQRLQMGGTGANPPVRAARSAETAFLHGGKSRQLVQRMVEFIHEHYSHPMQLGDLAAHMKMNATYVSSLFSETMGVTFSQYLENIRIARAKELLRDPLRQIREVARASGYSNTNHFREVFKSRVGVHPTAWREMAGTAPASGTRPPTGAMP